MVEKSITAIMRRLAARIFLGTPHGTWHFVASYLGASAIRGEYWLPQFVFFVAAMTATRVIIVWVYTHTRTVLLAQLLHAGSTGFLAVLPPLSISPANDTLFYAVYTVVLWGVVAILAVVYGKHLARQPVQVQARSNLLDLKSKV